MTDHQDNRRESDSLQPAEAQSARPAAVTGRVLVMNHQGEALATACDALRTAGFQVQETHSVQESRVALEQTPPHIIVLDPLVLSSDGPELELVEGAQNDGLPTPVVFLVESVGALDAAIGDSLPFRDFVVKPHALGELAHRVRLQFVTLAKFIGLRDQARALENRVSIDFKTGLISEQHFRHLTNTEFKRAQRHCLPLSLLLVDVDNFKAVNDSTVYAFGDEVLRRVSQELQDNTRDIDFAARFGGDEFAVLLPHTTPSQAVLTAMRIRKRIAATVVRDGEYEHRVTVSIGIDTFSGRGEHSPDELRKRANLALKEAKKRGKDQVWLYSSNALGDESESATLS